MVSSEATVAKSPEGIVTFKVEVVTNPTATLKWRDGCPHYRVKPNGVVNISITRDGGPSIPLRVFLKINGKWLGGPPESNSRVVVLGWRYDRSCEFRTWPDGSPFTVESLLAYHPQGGDEVEVTVVGLPEDHSSSRGWRRFLQRRQQFEYQFTLSTVA